MPTSNFKHKIVALCGLKGCGKDFVANYINMTQNFEHLKISAKLKEISKILFDIDDDQIEGKKKECIDERWNVTPRQMMQFIGTEVFQYKIQELIPECDRNFWIKSFVNTMKVNKNKNVVVSDMRFLHEYDYINKHLHTHELIIIRIDSSTQNIYDTNDTHVSETEYKQIPVDYQITNTMTKNIEQNINTIVNAILIETYN
jgi:hypothetical protein